MYKVHGKERMYKENVFGEVTQFYLHPSQVIGLFLSPQFEGKGIQQDHSGELAWISCNCEHGRAHTGLFSAPALDYVKDRDGLGRSTDLESEGEVSDPGGMCLLGLLWQRLCECFKSYGKSQKK